MALGAEILARLTEIFSRKKWPIGGDGLPKEQKRFDKFCELLETLSPEEVNLVLDLTENYEYFHFNRALGGLHLAMKFVDGSVVANAENIFVFPVVAPDDEASNKSGNALIHPFLHDVLKPYLHNRALNPPLLDFHSLDSLKKHAGRNNSLIFAIDDFVGTGDTAMKFITKYEAGLKIKSDRLIFVCTAAMPRGIDLIRSSGYDTYTSLIHSRGISDSGIIDTNPQALDTMDAIESKLKFKWGCSHGFYLSEALISFTRTPDNTFPVYWTEETMGGKEWPAPFPR
jgi:hypothetical protein